MGLLNCLRDTKAAEDAGLQHSRRVESKYLRRGLFFVIRIKLNQIDCSSERRDERCYHRCHLSCSFPALY